MPFVNKKNIFRIQAYASIKCGYFCTGFIGFMLGGKISTDLTNLFLGKNFKNNDGIVLNCFLTKMAECNSHKTQKI